MHASQVPEELWGFFDAHCVECHDDVVSKGGLDLLTLEGGIEGIDEVSRWTQIYDRVMGGEMPPEDKPRPDGVELESFQELLHPPLHEADSELREVVQRRLNRHEFENSLNDLLGIEMDLLSYLPEDQTAGGFDTNGQALSVSAELFESYIEACREALSVAIFPEDRPVTEAVTVDSREEVKPYLGNQYALVDDKVFLFLRNKTSYSKISTRKHRTPVRGKYRFRFPVSTIHTEDSVVFSATASDFARTGATYLPLGFYEATSEQKTVTIEANLPEGFAIQFFAHGLPFYLKEPAFGEHPGVGFGPVEIEGPIYEQWPPRSHERLLGSVDLKQGGREDAKRIVGRLMKGAWRRTVSSEEVEGKLAIFDAGMSEGKSFLESLEPALLSVLCSPNFLFLESNDGTELSPSELASRLSYFLWSSLPDEQLQQAAASGELFRNEVLRAQVERILGDPKHERFVENFTGQWLKLRDINETAPDRRLYPDYDEVLQESMLRESRAFFSELLKGDLDIRNFIDSDFVMVNGRLAEHYGIEGVKGLKMRRVPLPNENVRGGVLTQASILKVTANGTNTSPVVRGIWVLENMLGKHVPPPPPNISGIEPDIRNATTIREQLALHSNEESCAGCHKHIDPPGFALESFDPVGAFRENYLQFKVSNPEKGWGSVVKAKPVECNGKLSSGEEFDSIVEFKELMLSSESEFARCLAERLATYALGRELGFSDRAAIEEIVAKTKEQGNGFRTLIQELIASPLFTQP